MCVFVLVFMWLCVCHSIGCWYRSISILSMGFLLNQLPSGGFQLAKVLGSPGCYWCCDIVVIWFLCAPKWTRQRWNRKTIKIMRKKNLLIMILLNLFLVCYFYLLLCMGLCVRNSIPFSCQHAPARDPNSISLLDYLMLNWFSPTQHTFLHVGIHFSLQEYIGDTPISHEMKYTKRKCSWITNL